MKLSLPAALVVALAPAMAGDPVPPNKAYLTEIVLEGGDENDHGFTRAALGLLPGFSVEPAVFGTALGAVRNTDRFRRVEGRLEEVSGGVRARIHLEPWPALHHWEIRGRLPASLKRQLLPGIRTGMQVGDQRLARAIQESLLLLRGAGYPQATFQAVRHEGGRILVADVELGKPSLIRAIRVQGDPRPYGAEKLIRLAGVIPGKTLWTEEIKRRALFRLRRRFQKDKRFEWQGEFQWRSEGGTLELQVCPGPVVQLRKEGEGLFFLDLGELVPLARADRFSPEILDEGDRRILRYLRGEGYLEAQVSHRREVLRGPAEAPEVVQVTYCVNKGSRFHIEGIRFERNREIPEEELAKAVTLPLVGVSLGSPVATPELLGLLEDRLKAFYVGRGFADVSIRRVLRLDPSDGKHKVFFQIREGEAQFLDSILLEVPSGEAWRSRVLAESLLRVFSDHPILEREPDGPSRHYRSDRLAMKGITARLEPVTDPARPGVTSYQLVPSRPLPLLKSDLAAVFSQLRQQIAAMGVARPSPRFSVEKAGGGYRVKIEVQAQPQLKVNRLVVQGADRTRAKAVLRETQLEPGMPLDPDLLIKAQVRVSDLGAFQRTDLIGLSESLDEGAPNPWKEGDLLLKVQERSPWVFGHSFGYDRSQGYHVGMDAQRLNVAGMGRTLDFGLRAGDATIQNPTMRRLFPTGSVNRSLDSFSVGYTDPWVFPNTLDALFGVRAAYRMEAAYIEETQAAYSAHRRRVVNSLEWKLSDVKNLRIGHRFERTDVMPNLPGILDSDLYSLARSPDQSIVSAPYVQLTVDRRDRPLDPTEGTYFSSRMEFANQLFGTSPNSSFVKLDMRHQWNWSFGHQASRGVLMAAARIGLARPTAGSAEELPLSERFFAGGPFSVRGVEPDCLGPLGRLGLYDQDTNPSSATYGQMVPRRSDGVHQDTQLMPLGGQGLVVLNLEYRFPFTQSQTFWGEVFLDSGQVYASLSPGERLPGTSAPFPALRTTFGVGLIVKIGIPIKFEYATDVKRLLGRPRSTEEVETQLKNISFSAGFQF